MDVNNVECVSEHCIDLIRIDSNSNECDRMWFVYILYIYMRVLVIGFKQTIVNWNAPQFSCLFKANQFIHIESTNKYTNLAEIKTVSMTQIM